LAHELKRLCDVLDAEIERQQTVQAVCEAQHDALCARDVAAIGARNEALDLLAHESEATAPERDHALAAALTMFDLKPGRDRLRHLAQHVPAPWGTRLEERRDALRSVVEMNQRLVRRNAIIAEKSKSIAESWRETLFNELTPSGPAYSGNGGARTGSRGAPAMIDQRG
jgi:flagellar biosynthesis/type III secretory pathway chaperone